jgi:type IV pilus assembly protein PilW
VTYDPIMVSPQIYSVAFSPSTSACAAGWVDMSQPIFGINANSPTHNPNPYTATCIPAADYKEGTDILVLRHAEGRAVTALAANTIYLLTELDRGSFFLAPTLPVTPPAAATNPSAIHEMNIHVYYIRPWATTAGDGIPTLVRETLTAGPRMVAQPLVEGIESMQISYGVDITSPGDKVVDRYYPASSLSTDTAVSPNWSQVVAVRIELLVRTPLGDGGFGKDTNAYTLGDIAIPAANDRFRRGVYSTTVMLRNHRKT